MPLSLHSLQMGQAEPINQPENELVKTVGNAGKAETLQGDVLHKESVQ